MTPPHWNTGDLFSVGVGLVTLCLRMWLRPAQRTLHGVFLALGGGTSIGPLLLFILDPVAQLAGFHVSLLEIAVEEGRVTLWVGSVVATLYILRDLF